MKLVSKKYLKTLVRQSICDTTLEQKPPYTYARLVAFIHGTRYEGQGFAKCKPGEVFGEKRGYDVAKGHAVRDIVDQMLDASRHLTGEAHWGGAEVHFSFPIYQPGDRRPGSRPTYMGQPLPETYPGALEVK